MAEHRRDIIATLVSFPPKPYMINYFIIVWALFLRSSIAIQVLESIIINIIMRNA